MNFRLPPLARRLRSTAFTARGWPLAIAGLLIGAVMLTSALVIAMAVLIVGAIAAAGIYGWSLVTGRKPTLAAFVSSAAMRRGRRPDPAAARRAPQNVIDIDVREVPDAPQRPDGVRSDGR